MDLETKMYVCYGSSLISEKKAFDKAMEMLSKIDITINSIRLDRYYSFPCYVNQFKNSKVFIIPRKNVELANGFKWHETLKNFLLDTQNYLKEYFQRNNSESGWASDKKMFGWRVSQKREDRIDTSLFVRSVWHNLLLIYV
jgi:transposase